MTNDMIIAGLCLIILAVCQGIKLYQADKEYKEERERFFKRFK